MITDVSKRREYHRTYRQTLRKNGMCWDCVGKAVDGKTRCKRHLAAHARQAAEARRTKG